MPRASGRRNPGPPKVPRETHASERLWKVSPPWKPAAKPARYHRGLEAFGFHTSRNPDGGFTYKPLTRGVGPFYSIGVGSFYVVKATLVFLGQTTSQVQAQEGLDGFEDRRVMAASRLQPGESINLDGRLDEISWGRAEPATEFIQIDPDNGAAATEPTEVYILFNDNNMYMGVILYDSEPDQLMGNTMQRDAFLDADDRFMWVFDTYLDERTGYFFEMNPSGAMGDQLVSGGGFFGGGGFPGGGGGFPGGGGGGFGGGGGGAWDGIWDAEVRRSEIGWVIEVEMPFRTLNFDPNAQAWGINFQRTVRRKNEETIWNGFGRTSGGLRRMSNAGLIVGMSEISQGIGLDVRPYATGRARSSPGNRTDASYTGDSGVDFIYNVTPSLRANFTVNTDFAETEVDDRQVNLTRFSLRFPEKRNFFLEGSNFFSMSGFGDAFFSRRIGLTEGQPQRVDYGVKLTGQAGAQDIGILQVRTGEDGVRPGEDFTVFRGARRILTESHFGMLYTRRSTREDQIADPASIGPALQTLGFDVNLTTRRFMGDKNLSLTSHYVTTTNPDDTGNSARYGTSVNSNNDLVGWRVGFTETQANFDPAVGFVNRTGIKQYDSFLRLSPRPENHPLIRQFQWSVGFNQTDDSRNVMLSQSLVFDLFQMTFHTGDFFGFGIFREFERLQSDFRMGPNGSVILPAGTQYRYNSYDAFWNTSSQRPVSFGGRFRWGDYFSGTRRDFGPRLTIRPRSGLSIGLDNQWTRIELPQGSFSVSTLRGEVNAQFSPWISFADIIQYDNDSRNLGWQARFRWILNPGNDLYLVYNHNWLSDPLDGLSTFDRQLASKLVYTHRF